MALPRRLLPVVLLLAACDETPDVAALSESAVETAQAIKETTAVEPQAPTGPDLDADDRAETESYVLQLRPAETYRQDELSQFTLAVEGQNGWHLNAEFPFSVTVAHVDALSLPKTSLGKDDAATFGEEGVRMEIPLTASVPGEQALSAKVEFAVCNPSSCVPVTETLGLRLAVIE